MKNINIKKYKRRPGIYCITNTINNYVYVGSTVNLYARLIHHRAHLISNKHSNPYLQNAFNKYGINNFKIKILEFCNKDKKELYAKECYYCKQYNYLYNIATIEEISFGRTIKFSKEAILKMSNSKKGKTPKNLKDIQQKRRRKIKKIVNEIVVEIYDSCTDAAKSLNMTPNLFTLYIGRKLKQSSKYFSKNTRYEYYE